MTTTITSNIELEEGSDIVKTFLYKDHNTGLPKDTTGCVVELQIKFEFSPVPTIYRSDVSPYILLGGSTGLIEVNVPWLTEFNTDLGKGTYNLYITTAVGIKIMHSKGFLTIIRSGGEIVIPGTDPSTNIGSNMYQGRHEMSGSLSMVLASDHPLIRVSSSGGLGTLYVVPNASSIGTSLGTPPTAAVGVRLYLGQSDSVTFTIDGVAPEAPPECTFTASYAITGPNWDENLSAGQKIYVTAKSGTPKFRWI